MELCVIGAGGHGQVVVSALQARGDHIAMILDDAKELWGQNHLGIPIKGPIEEYSHLRTPGIVAIGDNAARKAVSERLNFAWATVVHPFSWVDPSAKLKPGTFVNAGAVIQPHSTVGFHVIVNACASVGHDCQIGDFAHLAPAVHVGGHSRLGEGAFMAIGSVTRNFVTVGEWTTVGVGAAVVKDLPANVVAMGVPARTK